MGLFLRIIWRVDEFSVGDPTIARVKQSYENPIDFHVHELQNKISNHELMLALGVIYLDQPLMLKMSATKHLNVIKELPIVGFTTCGKGMGLGESFVQWPCFGFAIFFFKMLMVVNNKIIMKKDFPMNLIIQLWAKLNSFAILKKNSQNS